MTVIDSKKKSEKQDLAWALLALLAEVVTQARGIWDEGLSDQIARAIHRATVAIA